MTLPSPDKLHECLGFARELAREAGRITLRYFRTELAVEQKGDDSPVTIADRETEAFLRRAIRERFPDHGILGEEGGEENPGARARWILDPIDGTLAFIHGVPLYTVLVALEWEGEAVLGMIHCPPQDDTVAAARGLGCRFNGQPCRVSDVADLAQARLLTTDCADLTRRHPRFAAEILSRVQWHRGWSDAYAYMLVATGRAEIALDPIMSVWDNAPLKPIVEEAGGKFTDFNGAATIHGTSALATNGRLHEEILGMLKSNKQ